MKLWTVKAGRDLRDHLIFLSLWIQRPGSREETGLVRHCLAIQWQVWEQNSRLLIFLYGLRGLFQRPLCLPGLANPLPGKQGCSALQNEFFSSMEPSLKALTKLVLRRNLSPWWLCSCSTHHWHHPTQARCQGCKLEPGADGELFGCVARRHSLWS